MPGIPPTTLNYGIPRYALADGPPDGPEFHEKWNAGVDQLDSSVKAAILAEQLSSLRPNRLIEEIFTRVVTNNVVSSVHYHAFSSDHGCLRPSGVVQPDEYSFHSFNFDPAHHAVAGRTLTLVLRAEILSPAAVLPNMIRCGMYPFTVAGTHPEPTVGSLVPGSQTGHDAYLARTINNQTTAEFTPPAAGQYLFGVLLNQVFNNMGIHISLLKRYT